MYKQPSIMNLAAELVTE